MKEAGRCADTRCLRQWLALRRAGGADGRVLQGFLSGQRKRGRHPLNVAR